MLDVNGISRCRSSALLIKLMLGVSVIGVLSGCAQSKFSKFFQDNSVAQTIKSESIKDPETRRQLLAKATRYWATEFAKDSTNPETAVNLAINLKAQGQYKKAMSTLDHAYRVNPENIKVASEYGRLALKMDKLMLAEKLLMSADRPDKQDWRVVSAIGALHAKRGNNKEAQNYFIRAQGLAPNQSSILNNLALSYALDGNPEKAEQLLRDAIARGQENKRIRQNLALVLGLQGRFDEAKSEVQQELPARLAKENVSYLKQMVKVEAKKDIEPANPPIVRAPVDLATDSVRQMNNANEATLKKAENEKEVLPWLKNSQNSSDSKSKPVVFRGTTMPEQSDLDEFKY